ncbi:PepSY-associated TM helix domain-containing protein [Erwinia amylovora]|uniref:PepSY-associated TM helix domain-containing protein n=1 Tax=Erwinia amylovora TaxID=552 RepID=UPI0002C9DA18|nr:PepSY-associated TM helix domain-containing protein [Erwinia amylovora]CCP08395.1 putative integral membrane protein [Erwinia amylovora MR1]
MEKSMSEQIRHASTHATSPRSGLPALLRRLHFDIGLFIAPFIFIAAFTGTLYVMTPQLEKVLYQRQLLTSSSGADQPLSAQVARASEFIGADAKIAAVRPAPQQGETTRVMFYRADLGPSETRAVFIDPKTLEVRGVMTVYGTSGILPLRTWLDYLHRNLLLGDVGRVYSELAASWLWVTALGGALLWVSNRAARRKSASPQSTPARRLARFRQWHTAVGLALLVGMVFFSATGLTWSRWAGDNISLLRSHFGWLTPVVNTALHPAPAMEMAMDEHAEHQGHSQIMHDGVRIFPYQFDAVLHAARAAGIDAAKLEIRPAYRADRAWTVSETDHRWPTQVDSVAVDPQNNAIVDKVGFAQFGLLARLTRWGVDAHMGVLFGIANQLVLALFGLGLCLMIAIGYRMWWLRRPGAGETSPFATLLGCWRQLTPGIRLMLLMLTGFVAVSLPVMGVSLLILLVIDRWRWQRSIK